MEGKDESLVKYTYKNGNGRLKAITYANGHTMKASYNSAGQMTSEKWYETEEAAAPMAHYKYVYDGQGNIVRSIDVLGEKEYNYSYEDGRLIRATESDITLSGEIVTTKTVVNTIRYYYDEEGQLERKVISPAGDTSQVIYYEHSEDNTSLKFYAGGRYVTSHSKNDSFGRKEFDELQVGTGFVSRQFNYHTGEVTDEHIENEKLKSSPITQLVSNIVFSDGRILSYEYDAEEHITKVTDTLGETETVTEYTYDALGQLLTEKVNGVVVNAMTYDNYGNILSKNGITYTYGNTKWKDLLTRYGNQNITYDAWGVCTINQDISGCGIAQVNPYRYRGYYYDADTKLYYLQSRYYDAKVGRFVNGDMVEVAIFKQEVLEHNLFGYCSNNAIMNVDYNGYWKEYWGTFNSKQVGSFTLKLDNKRKEIKKKFGWVAWAGIAIAIVGAIVGAIFLFPAGGAVLGIGITLCTTGIQMLVDLYPNELDNIANSIRNALKKSKKKILKIYFLWGSHTNQIKITDNVTNKTYKKITIRTNAIQDLVTFAKNSNVKISSRDVKWQYSY